MNLKNVEKHEKNMVTITVEVGKDEFAPAIEKAYKKQVKQIKVPGFRPGHAPRKVIEGMYGAEVFYDEAMNIAFPAAYQAALEEADLAPVEHPSVEVTDVSGDGFTFKATFANYPEVKLGDYKGLSAVKPSVEVTDEMVDNQLKQMRERNARLVSVEREAQNGDTAVIDFEGKKDGVPFEGGKGENYPLELGSGTFIPGFEEQVVGMKVGEEKDVNVKFPDDYQAEDLKGKDAVFAVKLNKLEKKELPEISDEFIKDAAGAESVEAYKKETRERLEKQAKEKGDAETENNILRAVTEKAEVEIPDAMIENQIDMMVRNAEYRLGMQYGGMKLADYLRYMGSNMEDFRKGYRAQAEDTVKSQLVVDKIIREENIKAEESEIDAKLEEFAKSANKTLEEYKKDVDESQREYIGNDIVINKLFDFLKANNNLTEKAEEPAKKPAAKKTAKKAAEGTDEGAEKPAAKKPAAKKTAKKAENEEGKAE